MHYRKLVFGTWSQEKLVRLFKDTQPTLAKVLPRRGWAEMRVLPPGDCPAEAHRPRTSAAASPQVTLFLTETVSVVIFMESKVM